MAKLPQPVLLVTDIVVGKMEACGNLVIMILRHMFWEKMGPHGDHPLTSAGPGVALGRYPSSDIW